jgi:hypothetical protein
MKVIKLGLISVVVFGFMLLCFTAIMPSHIRVSRAENIYSTPAILEKSLKELKAKDSFPYQWELYPFDTITTVQLYYDFHLKWYPWEKLGSIIYDKQLGPSMEKELRELKASVEIK